MNFSWNEEKNQALKKDRNVTFEDMVVAINSDHLLDVIQHPNKKKYPNQSIYIVCFLGYVYTVPFLKKGEFIFLKTIIPSRKINKIYGGQCDD